MKSFLFFALLCAHSIVIHAAESSCSSSPGSEFLQMTFNSAKPFIHLFPNETFRAFSVRYIEGDDFDIGRSSSDLLLSCIIVGHKDESRRKYFLNLIRHAGGDTFYRERAVNLIKTEFEVAAERDETVDPHFFAAAISMVYNGKSLCYASYGWDSEQKKTFSLRWEDAVTSSGFVFIDLFRSRDHSGKPNVAGVRACGADTNAVAGIARAVMKQQGALGLQVCSGGLREYFEKRFTEKNTGRDALSVEY